MIEALFLIRKWVIIRQIATISYYRNIESSQRESELPSITKTGPAPEILKYWQL